MAFPESGTAPPVRFSVMVFASPLFPPLVSAYRVMSKLPVAPLTGQVPPYVGVPLDIELVTCGRSRSRYDGPFGGRNRAVLAD